MKTSDLLDRWTILIMKAKFSEEAKKELAEYEKEAIMRILDGADGLSGSKGAKMWGDMLMTPLMRLMEANAKIWENESAIRREGSDPAMGKELDLAEVGRRALLIRDYNKQRVESKQALDKFYLETPDVKVDHASQ